MDGYGYKTDDEVSIAVDISDRYFEMFPQRAANCSSLQRRRLYRTL